MTELTSSDGLRFRTFYGRRVVRLIPASLLVVAVTGVATLSLNIADRSVVVHDIVPAVFGFANWHLISNSTNYWKPHATATPLDHYWSLAVEDQFYLVWPTAIFFAWKSVRRRANPLLFVTVFTAALAVAGLLAWHAAPPNGAATYFATQYRLGELLLGCTTALVVLQLRKPLPSWAPALGCIVLAVVATWLAFTRVSVDISKYGTFVSVVTAGALFALAGARQRPFVNVLRWRPVVYIGTISYGIYLWHFPVDQILGHPHDATKLRLLLIVKVAATGALAALSYKLLEHPLRVRAADGRLGPRRAFAGALVGVVTVAMVVPFVVNASLDGRQGVISGREMVAANRDHPSWGSCVRVEGPFCVRAAESRGPILAVIGDSHAMQWDAAWKALARERGAELYFARQPCAMAPGLQSGGRVRCDTKWAKLAAQLIAKGRPVLLVLAFKSIEDSLVAKPLDATVTAATAGFNEVMRVFDRYGLPIVVLKPIPELREDVPRCLALHHNAADCSAPATQVNPFTHAAAITMIDAAAAASPNVAAIAIDEIVCPGGTCLAIDDGVITRQDNDHVSVSYATVLAPKMIAAIGQRCSDALRDSWFCKAIR